PEQATEAMNRLAQAYGCLTDSAARKAYDESLLAPTLVQKQSVPHFENGPADSEAGHIDAKDPLAWLFGPWHRLADPNPPGAPGNQPNFRDWAASAPPPQKRRASAVDQNGPGVPTTPQFLEEPDTRRSLLASF